MIPQSTDTGRTDLNRFGRALAIQGTVIGALVMRELHTRFGRDNIGYLWLIGEPLMLATVISVMHIFMGGSHGGSGSIQPGVFTLVGYTIFIIFRGIFNRAEGTLEANLPLMYHKMVTIFDMMVARAIVETAGCVSALIILLSLFIVLGLGELPYRPLYLAAAIIMMSSLSFGLSLIVTGCTFGHPTAARLVHPISYFMIPLSGAFWMMEWIPQPYRDMLSWNPMVIIFEIARYGQFRSASPDYVDFGYVITCIACITYTGLIAITRVKGRIHLG